MTTTEHEEMDTVSASESEDQLSRPIVYSLTMDYVKECIRRIPAQDQHTILMELCSSLGKQLVDLLTHTKGLYIISEADFTDSLLQNARKCKGKGCA